MTRVGRSCPNTQGAPNDLCPAGAPQKGKLLHTGGPKRPFICLDIVKCCYFDLDSELLFVVELAAISIKGDLHASFHSMNCNIGA